MPTHTPLRLAMWSGPRNISTAMMRSWGNRDDTVVCDEPLYAHYLAATGKAHPGADEVIAAGQTDWRKAVAALAGDMPGGKRIFYQKHMTHHLLPQMDRQWLRELTHCFLIRHPRQVLASYAKVIEAPTLADLGFLQQTEIFEYVNRATGKVPPVIDAADVLRDPRGVLSRLCDVLRIEFQESMLAWPPGPRSTDGVWARYWYAEVERSTGFRPYSEHEIDLPPALDALARECLDHYDRLCVHRLT